MKKKLIALVLVVAVTCVFLFTGCTFIRVNEERRSNEVMATVSMEIEGQNVSLNVSRNELISYANYIINLYSQYGMSLDSLGGAEALVEQGLDSLIGQKYMTLKGMAYLLSIEDRKKSMYMNTKEYKDLYGDKITPEGVLTIAERLASIKSTNENFISNIDEYKEDYETEQRELVASTARERLAALYADGYSVKDDGVKIYHEDENGDYQEGLYQTSIVKSASSSSSSSSSDTETVEVDYLKIILQITMEKTGAEDENVYLPVASAAVTTVEDEDADFVSNYITAKTCQVTYDEPVEGEDGETTYETHTAEADFTLVTPRTAYKGVEEEDTRSDEEIFRDGDVKFRYDLFEGELGEEQQKVWDEGQIFVHSPSEADLSDAEREAYRQFRESKKNLLINFDASKTDDPYNALGYYYLSGFESAILSAVQFEVGKAALTEKPVDANMIEEQYKILVNKQKEEYDSLRTNKEKIDKFASAIGTDLTSVYYVPIDALKAEEFEYKYTDSEGNEQTYKAHYAEENADGTVTINMFYIAHILFKWNDDLTDAMDRYITDRDDDEVKKIKERFLESLDTNKSVPGYATAEEEGDKLADAFEVDENGNILNVNVLDAIAELEAAWSAPENSDKTALEVFQEYMTYYNDDGGTMSSDLGYLIAMGDISHTYDGDDFPNMAKNLYVEWLQSGNTADPSTAQEITQYAFTSYGMHIEKISFAPFWHINLTDYNGLGVNFELDLKGSTMAETLKDSLESNIKSKAYSEWTSGTTTEEALSHGTKDAKKMKRLLKDLGF